MLYPVPAVMVSCARPSERPNIITVAWTGTVCSNPAMVSISVRPQRYSYNIIRETGEFVINPRFDYTEGFYDGFALVSVCEGEKPKWGFVNKKGEYINKSRYHDAYPFYEVSQWRPRACPRAFCL